MKAMTPAAQPAPGGTATAPRAADVESFRRMWERKPLLREVYRDLYRTIAGCLRTDLPFGTLEIGSGIGTIKEVIPRCVTTDLLPNPWVDRTEDVYAMSLRDGDAANVVLFHVFHHLRYPGAALAEIGRVLCPGGRLVIFDPCVSLLGYLIYGVFHPEPLGLGAPIEWVRPAGGARPPSDYYSAQGNASRVFLRGEFRGQMDGWNVVRIDRLALLSYMLSGGYRGRQLYPTRWLPFMRRLDRLCDRLPGVFATCMLVVLEKRDASSPRIRSGLPSSLTPDT